MLTEMQKSQIRLFLGYSDLYRYQDVALEGALDGNLSAEAEYLIVTTLTALAVVEAAILGSSISQSGLKKVDEIEFFAGRATTEIKTWGRMYVKRIAVTLGVPILTDVFSAGPMNNWMSLG